jgi:hypothetical protein
MMTPHLPKHWVAGICVEGEWQGEFFATADELLLWCEEQYQDEQVVLLVLRICDAQEIYQEWWEKVKNARRK